MGDLGLLSSLISRTYMRNRYTQYIGYSYLCYISNELKEKKLIFNSFEYLLNITEALKYRVSRRSECEDEDENFYGSEK